MIRRGWHVRRMTPLLSALRDGDLGRGREALLRWHLRRCAGCRDTLAELEAQVAALQALRSVEAAPGEGEEAGWQALLQALRAAPPSADPADALPMLPGRPLRPVPWPVLAGALVGVGALLGVVGPRLPALLERAPSDDEIMGVAAAEFREAELHYQRALEQLQRVSARSRAGWTPAEVRAYEARLGELRQATERRRALALQYPADAEAQERLYAAYRSQIAFIQDSLRRRAVLEAAGGAP